MIRKRTFKRSAVVPIIEFTFFGCRGSTPVSGPQFVKYGGNTTCFALITDSRLLIVDCGTGLAPLQSAMFNSGRFQHADIFLTHIHWDHIQGIPFFGPFFIPGRRFTFYGEARDEVPLRQQLSRAMEPPMFPVRMESFNAEIAYHDISCGDCLELGEIRVKPFRLRHPDICTGFRFEAEGKSICIVGDYEHGEGGPIEAARDADLVIYDAQYTDAEYPSKVGWGHSTWRQGCAFAQECGAKQLILTHHDPWRDDSALDAMEEEARLIFPSVRFASEGMRIKL